MTVQFMPGDLFATEAAARLLNQSGYELIGLISRHVTGNHGEVTEPQNYRNLSRIRSQYDLGQGKILIITDPMLRRTNIMLPEEYNHA